MLVAVSAADRAAAQTITIDPASAVEAAGSSVSFNHTVGAGSNRLLIVSVAIERNDATVASVTYAGQPLTFLGRVTDTGAGATLDLWARLAPTSGTHQTVVTLSNSAAVVVGAKSFANVDQANPFSGSFFIGNGTIASGTITTSANQLVLATLAANDEVNSVTVGAGQTSRYNVLNAADVIGAASTKPASAGSTSMSYSLGSSGRWVLAVIALRPANPFVVTNTNDSGAGSLRAAIDAANANPGADTISFAITGTGPHTITLSSALPTLTDNGTVIDGTTQAGTQCRDLWAGSGHDLRINVRGGGFNGFVLNGSNQTIRGLALTGFDNAIVTQAASSSATIQCNYLGLLPNGTSSGNTRGVLVRGASVLIGGLAAGQGNVISANSIVGVVTENGSTDTTIRGNFIGTDATGMTARANGGGGINNFFGTATWRDITYNLISGNNGAGGIALESDDRVSPSTDTIRIQRNIIGFTRDLSALLRNGGDGIRFPSPSITNVLIGGDATSAGNTIAGTDQGISLTNTPNITIQGNVIARSGQNGVRASAVNGLTIGGAVAGLGNMVGGNGGSGLVVVDGTSNATILGNIIGAVSITGDTFENRDRGIFLRGVSNLTIGNGSASGRNVIARNGLQAILANGTLSNVTVEGNFIGTDSSGNAAVANATRSDTFTKDAVAFSLGNFSGITIRNNVIGGHAGALIEFWDSTATDVTIQGNSLGVGAGGAAIIPVDGVEPLLFTGGPTRQFSNVLIGGFAPGQGNIIANGGFSGIRMESTGSNIQVIGNTIRNNAGFGVTFQLNTSAALVSNRIFDNGLIGIDLEENWITPNDAGDGDTGSNDLLNFPEAIRAVVIGPNELRYNFALDVPAAANGYRIEFFASSAADPTGFGEGERYLGAVDVTHAGGVQNYAGTLTTLEPVSIGDVVSATTTRRTAGGAWDITSEFSAVAFADGVAALSVAMASQVFDPPAGNPFATPGNDILLTTTVSNGGSGSTDPDSLFVAIALDTNNVFFNDVTPALGGVVGFQTAAPALTFTPATDLRFSNSAAAPASMAECTYTPSAGYDPQVRHVCLNPKGSLPSGEPEGQFSVQIRARIN